jgi:hypothetical protein
MCDLSGFVLQVFFSLRAFVSMDFVTTLKDTLTDELEIAKMEELSRAAQNAKSASAAKDAASAAVAVSTKTNSSPQPTNTTKTTTTTTPSKGKSTKTKGAAKAKASPVRPGSPTKVSGSSSTPSKGDPLKFMSKVMQLANKPEELAAFLLTIPAAQVPKLVSNRLEGDHLVAVLGAVQYLEPGPGLQLLISLTTVR